MRSSYSRRPVVDGVACGNVAAIQTIGNEPKVYWNGRHRVYFGKYKLNGSWKNKLVPVCIDDEIKATKWFAIWLKRLGENGIEPGQRRGAHRRPQDDPATSPTAG